MAGSCPVCSLPFQFFLSNFFPFSLYSKKQRFPFLFSLMLLYFWFNLSWRIILLWNLIVEMLQQKFSVKGDAVSFHSGEIWSWAPYNHSTRVYLTLKWTSSQRNSANILTAEKDYCTGKVLPIILFLSFIIGLSEQWMDKSQLN